ncbi:MAG: hypothetical protein GF333_06495 [Candidatus Omnitrophica bacterium]|nr:hypothetical protein [Candidatus Omnitrophota bacterium]
MHHPFEIIFSDEFLLVVDKRAKIPVQPAGRGKEKLTLTRLVREREGRRVYLCHRLDRETSGLLLYARDRRVQQAVMDQFRAKSVRKRYFAFVQGRVRRKSGVLEGRILDRYGKRYGKKARFARTRFAVRERFAAASMLELFPETGRTHQLRIQLAGIGHPIIGERIYAFGKDFSVKFRRMALHAHFLAFRHPVSGERVECAAALPPDLRELRARLQK